MMTRVALAETGQGSIKHEKLRPTIMSLTGDRSKDPVELKLFFAKNPGLKKNLADALKVGFQVNFHKEMVTPQELRSAFQNLVIANGDLNTFTAEALVEGKDMPQVDYVDHTTSKICTADVEGIREKAKSLLRLEIVEEGPQKEKPEHIGEPTTKQLAYDRAQVLAEAFQHDPEVKRYQAYRLVTDRTKEETENVSNIITGAVKVGLGATILETGAKYIPIPWLRVAGEGSGILAAGSSDDIGNALGNTETKNGGKKQISQSERRLLEDAKNTNTTKRWLAKAQLMLGNVKGFTKDHLLVAGAVATAAGADYFVIPNLFENAHDLPTHLASALAFFSTAVAGSVASKIEMVSSSYKTIRRLDKEGKLPGREANSITRIQALTEAWRDNQSNPTRRGLFWGIVTSALVTLLAESATLVDSGSLLHYLSLHGAPTSGFIQAAIGPAESLIAVWGTRGLVNGVDKRTRNFRLNNELRRATRKEITAKPS